MELHDPPDGDVDDDQYFQEIIDYLANELDLPVLENTRYRYIQFEFDGDIFEAEVGEEFELSNKQVIAILEGGVTYYICTETRGAPDSSKRPIMIPKQSDQSDVLELERFET